MVLAARDVRGPDPDPVQRDTTSDGMLALGHSRSAVDATVSALNDIPRGAMPRGQGQGVRLPRRGIRLSPLLDDEVPAQAVLREVLAQPVGVVDDAALAA